MQDSALIETAKILVPPDPIVPYPSAGCTGALALFKNVTPAVKMPTVPTSLVSLVGVPRCPFCSVYGSLECYCSDFLRRWASRLFDEYSSAVWSPRIAHDLKRTVVDTYHNVQMCLDMMKHTANVKATAHVVSSHKIVKAEGVVNKTYKLGPGRFVVKTVLLRPSNIFQGDTLRQVAGKLRLLKTGSLSLARALRESEEGGVTMEEAKLLSSTTEWRVICLLAVV